MPRPLALAVAAALALLTMLLAAQPASAAGEDITITFAAADPASYDHSAGGGAAASQVTSLDAADYACGETVSYFNVLDVAGAATGSPQTLEITNTFAADAGGVGFTDIMNIVIDSNDPGQVNDGESQIGVIGFGVDSDGEAPFLDDGDVLTAGAHALFATFVVDDLDAGEIVVVRIDVRVECAVNATPAGSLAATLASAGVVEDASGGVGFDPAAGGVQTVSMDATENLDRSGAAQEPGDDTAEPAPEELPVTGDGADLAALLAVGIVGLGMISLGAAYRRGVGA